MRDEDKTKEELISDLTGLRQKASEEVRQETDKALQYLDIAGTIIVMLNMDGEVTFINRKGEQVLGRPREEILGSSWFDNFVPELDREMVKEGFRRIITGEIEHLEFYENPVVAGTGEERIIAWHSAVVTDAAGTIMGTLSSGEDITERKKAEEAVKQSEESLRLFIEHAPTALAMFDRQMRYLVVSRRWMSDYGLSDGDLIGRSHYEIFPEIPDRWKEVHRRGLEGEVVRADDDHFERADGSVQWLRWEVRPWYKADGDAGGIVIFTEDITARKHAEEALRESEERFSKAFQNSPDAVTITAVADGRLVDVNQALTRLSGYSRDECIGRTSMELDLWANPSDRDRYVAELREHGRVLEFEADFKTKARQIRSCLVSGEFVDIGGELYILGVIQDNTDRKAAEEALRKSEASIRNVFEQASDGIFVISSQNRYIDANARGLQMLGYTREELMQMSVADVLELEERHRLDSEPPRMMAGEPHLAEWMHLRKDGSTFPGEVSARKLDDETYIAIVRDLTERRRTEAALRASEERFRRAVIGAPFPMILHAEDGEVLQVSRSWSEISGYAPEDIPTISDWTERAYGERKEIVQADIDRLYALDRRITERDYTIRTKDGATRVWDFSSAPLGRLPDGRRLVISMAMDVTELKRAEEEREKFVFLAESSSEFIGMCDLDLQPLYVNPAGVRMVGLPDMAAACRVKVQDYFFVEDQPFITEEFFPRVMREGHGVVEIRLRHFQTGEPVWMSYYLFHLRDASGTVVGWATVSRDITERKKAQEEIYRLNAELEQRVLERTAQLEEANRDLESFSYSVSHDLRAPLRAISGFAEIIARRHRATLNDEGQRYFDNIVEASGQMGRLIDDLLRYSRLGRRAVRLQAVNPLGVVSRAIKTLTERIAESGAEIVIPEDMPVVHADPTLLEQIFTNLLENALTYRKSEGTLRIQISATVRDGYVVIEVSDNGIGISPEYHQKVFNMFQRLHSYDEYPGTGIGLAIVRKSATLMYGEVWVESEVGQGSRFFIKLAQAKPTDQME